MMQDTAAIDIVEFAKLGRGHKITGDKADIPKTAHSRARFGNLARSR